MSVNQNTGETQNDKEISLSELALTSRAWIRYIISKWKILVLCVLIGMGLGLTYSIVKVPQYTAECSFVFEEGNNKPDLGGLAVLGLDVGGNSGGLFAATSNIIWLYTSRLILQKTLLTEVEQNGKKRLLIDWFIEESKLQKRFNESPGLKNIRFVPGKFNENKLTREQNTIAGICVDVIRGKYLKVTENKGTKNIILVNFTSKDELFSMLFTNVLVEKANDFYVQTKTKKTEDEVKLLQAKADSFKLQMNSNIYQTASAFDATPNQNPNLQVLRVRPQQKVVDVQVSSAIYTEIVKLLEKRKMDQAQETPLIQVIDKPSLPLQVITMGKVKGIIIGGSLLGLLALIVLIFRRVFKNIFA